MSKEEAGEGPAREPNVTKEHVENRSKKRRINGLERGEDGEEKRRRRWPSVYLER